MSHSARRTLPRVAKDQYAHTRVVDFPEQRMKRDPESLPQPLPPDVQSRVEASNPVQSDAAKPLLPSGMLAKTGRNGDPF